MHSPRRLLAVLAAAVLGLFGAFLLAAPASAHTATVKGVANCEKDGTYTITWTVHNDFKSPLNVVDPVATPVPLHEAVGSVPAGGDKSATQVGVPATAGKAALSFKAVWPADNYTQKVDGKVALDGKCLKPSSPCPSKSASKSPSPRPSHSASHSPSAKPSPSHSRSASASPSHSTAGPSASASGNGGGVGGLPVTGTSLTIIVIAAVVLLGGGTALFVLGRRRRSGGQ